MRRFLSLLLILATFGLSLPSAAFANTQIRQEVNITDGYMGAASGSFATSSAIAAITDNNYTSPSYYFEVVASTSAATTASVSLVNATSSAIVKTISITGGNSYQRYRSTAFEPNASTTVEYKVVLNNEAVGKGVIAARIVVLQSATTLSSTETQIEIGNQETYTSSATSTFASPKYWYYDSTKWDGSPTFSATVTYANTTEPSGSNFASSTTITAAGTKVFTTSPGATSTVFELWGGGGAGGAGTVNTNGSGSGGAGGQYSKKTVNSPSGAYSVVIASVTAGGAGTGSAGGDTTVNSTLVVAKGGAGGALDSGAAGAGSITGGVGDTVNAGGNGAVGASAGTSGGGGEGGRTTGTGGSASGGTAGTGGDGGDGGAGRSTNGAGNPGNAPGGAGAGGRSTGNPNVNGGDGSLGQAIVREFGTSTITATTTIALQEDDGTFGSWTTKATLVANGTATSPTRTAAASFTPSSGKHYRVAFSNGYGGATFAIYNAKIVVNQGTVPGPSISNGTKYFLVIRRTGAYDPVNAFTKVGDGTNTYANGDTFVEDNSAWGAAVTTADWDFSIYSGGVLKDSNTAGTNLNTFGVFGGTAASGQTNQASGQSFTATSNYTLDRVDAKIKMNNGSLSESAYIQVVTGSINGPVIATSNLVSLVGLSTTAVLTTFTFSSSGTVSLLEPQYLLANTKYSSGTALQNFITEFDPAEWNTTNNYLHGVSAANSSGSVAGIYSIASALQTNSTVTAPNNYATSTRGICMPSVATDLDTKATTNNGDLYGDSILVQVGVTSTATGCAGGPAPQTSAKFFLNLGNFLLRGGALSI